MYDTARRVALVKQRVQENTRRRQRREAISLSAVCMLLCAALMQTAGTVVGPGQTAAWGVFGAMLSSPLPQRRRSPRCASGSETEKIRKKTGRTSPLDTNRRRKTNEKTNTQYLALPLHGGVYAPHRGVCGGYRKGDTAWHKRTE